MPASDTFPQLICCTRLGIPNDFATFQLYDVRFWPWASENEDQIFAVTGGRHVIICRPSIGRDPAFEVIRWWSDKDEKTSINSIAWTRHPETGKPILCIAGSSPTHITILDVESGTVIRTLTGHGRAINDLQISPLSTNILASASEDYTVRIWNLDPKYANQPCVAKLCGEGHRQPILAMHFHPNGRWLLTGGMDTAVALWAVPSLEDLHDPAAVDQEPNVVYYPHFYSTEVHYNYVDCLCFYGDLIISRAARSQTDKGNHNDILLWKITGFDADAPVPKDPPIPYPNLWTRSAFPHPERSRGFQRLLTFSMPNTDRFYLRFGFHHGDRPMLGMGSTQSRFSFWDLKKLEDAYDISEETTGRIGRPKKGTARKARSTASIRGGSETLSDRLGDLRRDASIDTDATGNTANLSSSSSTDRAAKSLLGDPFKPLKPHHEFVVNTGLSKQQHFATAQLQWSPNGEWVVGVGDNGVICLMTVKS